MINKILDEIWRFFSSVKLAVFIILVIVATSIIGTVIQQGLPTQAYIQQFGETGYRILNFFDIFDMYHSLWFELLLILLIVNVIVCSLERLPSIFKMFSDPKLQIPLNGFDSFKDKQTIKYEGQPEQIVDSLKNKLKMIYKEPIHTTTKDGDFLYLEKGRFVRFGPYVTHLSLILVFIGVLVGAFYGFDGYVNLSPGDSTKVVQSLRGSKMINLPFTITCNKFNVEFYNSGVPKAYKSDLSLFINSNVVAHKVIDVNQPLTYKGITIYQASYGQTGASNFDLIVDDKQNDEKDNVLLNLNQSYHVGNNSYIRVLDYSANYQGFGPTILVGVYKGNKLKNTTIYLAKYPDFHGAEAIDGYKIQFVKANTSFYTGLQVAKDPGSYYVATGAILLVIGLIMSFFGYRRRIWIFVSSEKTGNLLIAGVSDRNKVSFEYEFSNLVNEIKKGVK
ncbi:MAG: cytochrome c biogenesis protein ResB [Deltaproteobacteria bacterium]|nr:cytochrome c biogenesis protein ResB [Deltaproteobacteria bacterium]MCL5791936.1 cytochrome c biogenesis protein ResB [Deltaproteobacteria bacterium]